MLIPPPAHKHTHTIYLSNAIVHSQHGSRNFVSLHDDLQYFFSLEANASLCGNLVDSQLNLVCVFTLLYFLSLEANASLCGNLVDVQFNLVCVFTLLYVLSLEANASLCSNLVDLQLNLVCVFTLLYFLSLEATESPHDGLVNLEPPAEGRNMFRNASFHQLVGVYSHIHKYSKTHIYIHI